LKRLQTHDHSSSLMPTLSQQSQREEAEQRCPRESAIFTDTPRSQAESRLTSTNSIPNSRATAPRTTPSGSSVGRRWDSVFLPDGSSLATCEELTPMAAQQRLRFVAVTPVVTGLRRMLALITVCVASSLMQTLLLTYMYTAFGLHWPLRHLFGYLLLSEIIPMWLLMIFFLVQCIQSLWQHRVHSTSSLEASAMEVSTSFSSLNKHNSSSNRVELRPHTSDPTLVSFPKTNISFPDSVEKPWHTF